VSEAVAQPTETGKPFTFEREGFLLVLSGPSGAGKGTLVDRLVAKRPQCVFAISSTTRPKRSNEQEGVQYEFVSREEFERRRDTGYFLETAEVHGHPYGTPAVFVDENVRAGRVVVLDVDAGRQECSRSRPEAVSGSSFRRRSNRCGSGCSGATPDKPEVVERRLANAPGELKRSTGLSVRGDER
jgi:guanylate kinase